jgi:hypothetical protein
MIHVSGKQHKTPNINPTKSFPAPNRQILKPQNLQGLQYAQRLLCLLLMLLCYISTHTYSSIHYLSPAGAGDIEMLSVRPSVRPSRGTAHPITSERFDAGSPYSHHTCFPPRSRTSSKMGDLDLLLKVTKSK